MISCNLEVAVGLLQILAGSSRDVVVSGDRIEPEGEDASGVSDEDFTREAGPSRKPTAMLVAVREVDSCLLHDNRNTCAVRQ